MELCAAAVVAVRLDQLIRKELDLSLKSSFFWTDSTAVLFCIKNATKRFPVFVANRLATIETCTNINQWFHVPSDLSLAAKDLGATDWLHGPSFLLQPQSKWPSLEVTKFQPMDDLLPIKMPIVQTVTMVKQDCFNLLINRCSTLHKLKRLTARLLQFTSYLQHRV